MSLSVFKRLEAIATRVQAIVSRLETIAIKKDAISYMLCEARLELPGPYGVGGSPMW